MSFSDSLRTALKRIVKPTQLQIYGIVDGRMRLRIVAGITGAPTIDDDGRVHCATTAVFSTSNGDWVTEGAGDLVLPGTAADMVYRLTLEGRLVLDLGQENIVIVLFPANDINAPTPYRNDLTITRMGLAVIATMARPPSIALDTARPPDDE